MDDEELQTAAARQRRRRVAKTAVAYALQAGGGVAVVAGVFVLAGLGVALVVAGLAAGALGVLHEAGRL